MIDAIDVHACMYVSLSMYVPGMFPLYFCAILCQRYTHLLIFPSLESWPDIEFDSHQVLYRRCGYQAVPGGLQCERIVININDNTRCDYHTNVADLQAMSSTSINNTEVSDWECQGYFITCSRPKSIYRMESFMWLLQAKHTTITHS